jgi:transcription initiation factor TFIIB
MTTFDYSVRTCDLCGSSDIIINKDEGSLVCKQCGNVIKQSMIDLGREWRIFFGDSDDVGTRTGAPIKFAIHDKGITTDVKLVSKDKSNRAALERALLFSKYQKRIRVSNSNERNMYIAFIMLDEISKKLNLPERVRETAAFIYRKAINSMNSKGKSIKGLLAVSIYAASKICDYPVGLKNILETFNVKSRTFSKYYQIVTEFLPKETNAKMKTNTSINHIPDIVRKLGLGSEVEVTSKNILEKALSSGFIAGKSPLSLAAAAVYIACSLTDNKRTQRQIAEATGVTEVTIRNRSKELIRSLDINIEL